MKANLNKYLPIIVGVIALAVGVVGLMLSSQPQSPAKESKQLTQVKENNTNQSVNQNTQANNTNVTEETAQELLKALDELLNS